MKVIFLGVSGIDKGTQSEIISHKLSIPTIPTSNILRAVVKEGTPIGLQIKGYMDAGKLVPDEIIIDIIQERLVGLDCAGDFILDGISRITARTEALECHNTRFDVVLSPKTADSTTGVRVTDRRIHHVCGATYYVAMASSKREGLCNKCGGVLGQRKDDQPETAKRRLEIYHSQTEPLENFHEEKGVLKRVPDLGGIEEINTGIMESLGEQTRWI